MDTFSFLICLNFCSSFFLCCCRENHIVKSVFQNWFSLNNKLKELLLINRTKTWDVTWTSPQRLKTWLGLDLKDLRLDLDLDLRDLWTCLARTPKARTQRAVSLTACIHWNLFRVCLHLNRQVFLFGYVLSKYYQLRKKSDMYQYIRSVH